ncbi:hypothetical protein M918_01325 [Clostridium sp. BL8]|nr:hypothetical protein M918_01325 [Clostridium sp. BL8]
MVYYDPSGYKKKGMDCGGKGDSFGKNDKDEIIEDLGDGTFKIKNWDGYPNGPKPDGPFKILEGEKYDSARKEANKANANIHKQNPSVKGMQIHEVHPVKFGGSPTNITNKIPLTPKEHAKYTTWWNRLLRKIKK